MSNTNNEKTLAQAIYNHEIDKRIKNNANAKAKKAVDDYFNKKDDEFFW